MRERESEIGKGEKNIKKGGLVERRKRARAPVHARRGTVQARTHTARFSPVVYTLGPMRDDGPRRLLRHIE